MFNYQVDSMQVVQRLGIESSDAAFKQYAVGQVQRMLDKRMGDLLLAELGQDELRHLEAQVGQGDGAAQAWLEQRFPDYKSRYAAELELVLQEVGGILNAVVAGTVNADKSDNN